MMMMIIQRQLNKGKIWKEKKMFKYIEKKDE